MTTVCVGDLLVTTTGGDEVLVGVLAEVADEVGEDDELSPPNVGTFVSSPVSHTLKKWVPPPPIVNRQHFMPSP